MKRLIFFIFIFSLSCSSGSNLTNKTLENSNLSHLSNSNSTDSSNSVKDVKPLDLANTQSETPSTKQEKPLDLLEQRKQKALEMAKNAPPLDPENLRPKNATTILPDGSEFWAILDSKGVTETRVFKNHPQLDKIVRQTEGNNVTIKIYTKNGKIISVPKDKIKDLTGASSEQILSAAGIKSQDLPEKSTEKKNER